MASASTSAILVQHVFVLFLIVVTPLGDRYEIPRLKTSSAPRKKIRFYQKIAAAPGSVPSLPSESPRPIACRDSAA